MKLTWDHL